MAARPISGSSRRSPPAGKTDKVSVAKQRAKAARSQRLPVRIMIIASGDMFPLGQSLNVSDSGMLVETTERPPIDSILNIALAWGDDIYRTCVRVTRHDPNGIGVAFTDGSPEFLAALEQAGERRPKKKRQSR